jgi:hypothetical protein
VTERIGGHFVIDPGQGSSFFGAIVCLDGATDFPNSGNLLSTDVLGRGLLVFPNTSAEVFGDLALPLDPGWYALVFGSGLFGATGRGGAPANNPDIDSPTYIAHQVDPGWFDISPPNGPFHNFRFVVEGQVVPEPAMGSLMPCVALLFFRRRKR